MAITLYQGTHRTQFDGSPKANENCTPTSGANGIRASTGGRLDKSGAQVRTYVRQDEETSPGTPGWSLTDLKLACSRIGAPFTIGHEGWAGVLRALGNRQFVVLQGDSEEFPNGTCSGVFDGDHAVGIHPDLVPDNANLLLADPICRQRRWESATTLRRYAANFRDSISYGYFLSPVPIIRSPVAVTNGWVRVNGAWWMYDVNGNPATGYDSTTRTAKVTKGFSASIGRIIEETADGKPIKWGGRARVWGEILPPSAYKDTWVDLLDEPNVRYFPPK